MAELKRCKKCGKIYSWNSYFNGYMCECGNIERRAITNADRIRAMSDEELAEFLCGVNGCYQANCPGAKLCKFGGGLANGLKKWLQQPAEEVHADG